MKGTQPQKVCTKTRAETARFMEMQFNGPVTWPGKPCHHYGKCELRQLMDFLFDGPPLAEEEAVFQFREE